VAGHLRNVAKARFNDVNFFMDENILRKRMAAGKKTGHNPNVYEGQRFWGYFWGYLKCATSVELYWTALAKNCSIPVGDQIPIQSSPKYSKNPDFP
jgi:hypothetical protein